MMVLLIDGLFPSWAGDTHPSRVPHLDYPLTRFYPYIFLRESCVQTSSFPSRSSVYKHGRRETVLLIIKIKGRNLAVPFLPLTHHF